MDKYYNPYQAQELRIPASYREKVSQYTMTAPKDGAASSRDHSPFPRMVDFWFLAVCVGASSSDPDVQDSVSWHKFMDGTILSSDAWRVDFLSLLAIAKTGDAAIVLEPSKVMDICNRLAAKGLPIVEDMLTGGSEPIWNLSEMILQAMPSTGE